MAAARLLLTAAEAALALAISERTLWQLTRDKEIPVVRLGRSVRYDPADLKRFIESRKGR
jgi:excisionase family DNA binding protein